jgi:hypothetical protein
LDRRLGGPQSLSGRGGEEKNSQPPPELEPPIIQPVAQHYTTELFRLFSEVGYVIFLRLHHLLEILINGLVFTTNSSKRYTE